MKYLYEISQLERMKSNPWLSDREKAIFNLYYVRNWKIEDVAAELEISRRTVDRSLKSIRLKSLEIYGA